MNLPVEIDVHHTKQLLEDQQIVLIDCREPDEWELTKIQGAVLMPLSQWMATVDQLARYAGRQLVVHCHHGGRSLRVTQWLRQNGFPDAQNMTGGIDAWSQEVDTDVPRY